LNVRAWFPPVNQPVPGARKGRRTAVIDSLPENFSVVQDDLKKLPLCITSFPLHLKP
jgi:hypothetical protein